MNICVCGTGYVGLSNAVLLAQHHRVIALDIIAEKVDRINLQQSPIADKELEDYLANKPLNLRATLDKVEAYRTPILSLSPLRLITIPRLPTSIPAPSKQ